MAASRDDGLDWLVRRMEWEHNLRSLHARGLPTAATQGERLRTSGRGWPARPPRTLLGSPVRKRFRRPRVLKIRA
jgi:hypothetical protein